MILFCNYLESVSFVAAEELNKVPLLRSLLNGNNMILVNRVGSDADRERIV